MKMLRLTLLLICATLVIPALAQAEDCNRICRDQYLYCIEQNCNGSFYCPACDGYTLACIDWCENQP